MRLWHLHLHFTQHPNIWNLDCSWFAFKCITRNFTQKFKNLWSNNYCESELWLHCNAESHWVFHSILASFSFFISVWLILCLCRGVAIYLLLLAHLCPVCLFLLALPYMLCHIVPSLLLVASLRLYNVFLVLHFVYCIFCDLDFHLMCQPASHPLQVFTSGLAAFPLSTSYRPQPVDAFTFLCTIWVFVITL